MNARLIVLTLVGLAGGCNTLDVPDLNGPGVDDFRNHPTRNQLARVATGLLIGARDEMKGTGLNGGDGYISTLGILGRESYDLDGTNPGYVTELLVGPLSQGGLGGGLWTDPYRMIRNGSLILEVLDRVPDLTSEEREATYGFTQTMQALFFLYIINTRDTLGAPIDVGIPPGDPAPVVPKSQVFAHIANLLDSADMHLKAGGSAFPFGLGPGFAGFDVPGRYVLFNRALRARVAIYAGDFPTALSALGVSFLDPGQPLAYGVYHSYNPGENNLADTNSHTLLAHPSIETDAQLRADGTKDLRFQTKLARTEPRTVQGITSDLVFTIYPDDASPIPIIKNEELILLRAEANLGLGNLDAAVEDLTFIRVNSGGLPPYSGPVTPAAVLDELLYNRRYSLLWEGGHRWIDLRRYGRLGTLPVDLPSHKRFDKLPFPSSDCAAYSPPPSEGCSPEFGF
jgi:starch-binding outer membrane protein, SusD/RagB family